MRSRASAHNQELLKKYAHLSETPSRLFGNALLPSFPLLPRSNQCICELMLSFNSSL